MKGSDVLTYARYQLDDDVVPYKWTDKELFNYLNDAQDEVARRSHCIVQYPSLVSIQGDGNITFASITKKISKSSGGFLSAGGQSEVNTFEINDKITITGTNLNNGVKTIVSISDTEVVVAETIVDENNTSAFIEATRTATRLPLLVGVHTYRLHPSTIMVIRARPESLGFPLKQKSLYSLDSEIVVHDYGLGIDDGWYYESWETLEGNTYSFLEENGFIRVISAPKENDILWLIVSRIPKLRFTDANLSNEPEVPSQWHEDLIDWILHRAFLKPDSETTDLERAIMYEKSFTAKVGPRPSIQTEMNRKRWPPNQRMRPRQLGFGG